jgi:uncharacterized membrane protein YcaP (DUF421 family)
MDKNFKVFDFHRIFIGSAPPMFFLEIVFRTVIMYGYTVILLRFLGKRGIGQLSTLELAIIISFGSAVGDPMVGADVPIFHGMIAITVMTFLQIGLERLINKNKKVEQLVEGTANMIVDNGVIMLDCLKKDNLSKEDLFRALRSKDVDHLGQVNKAFFETSGQISVQFNSPKQEKPGLSVIPETEIPDALILKSPDQIKKPALYCCTNCGHSKSFQENQNVPMCEICNCGEWIEATR